MSSRKSGFYADMVFAGFGGQGILIAGNLLCYAALHEGREVTFFPSYGVEMRGGAANCFVVMSDRPIGSPIPSRPQVGLIMSTPALQRFQSVVQPSGIMVINTDIVHEEDVTREDVNRIFIPANRLSTDAVGSEKLANMTMVGFIAALTGCVKIGSIIESLKDVVSEKHKKMIPVNEKAILAGAEYHAGMGGKQ